MQFALPTRMCMIFQVVPGLFLTSERCTYASSRMGLRFESGAENFKLVSCLPEQSAFTLLRAGVRRADGSPMPADRVHK